MTAEVIEFRQPPPPVPPVRDDDDFFTRGCVALDHAEELYKRGLELRRQAQAIAAPFRDLHEIIAQLLARNVA